MPGVVDVVTAMAVAGRGRGMAVAQPSEAAGWELVVQAQHRDEVLPFEAGEVVRVATPH